jgi:hypothetical protein
VAFEGFTEVLINPYRVCYTHTVTSLFGQ